MAAEGMELRKHRTKSCNKNGNPGRAPPAGCDRGDASLLAPGRKQMSATAPPSLFVAHVRHFVKPGTAGPLPGCPPLQRTRTWGYRSHQRSEVREQGTLGLIGLESDSKSIYVRQFHTPDLMYADHKPRQAHARGD